MKRLNRRRTLRGALLAMSLAGTAVAFATDDTWVYDPSRHPADDVAAEQSPSTSLDASIADELSVVVDVDHGILTAQRSNSRRIKFGTAPGFLLFLK